MPQFVAPTIAATSDNHFVIAWQRYIDTDSGSKDDIYYTIRNSGGYSTKPITQLTSDTAGSSDGHGSPNLASLSGNKVLLSWRRYSDGYINYAVLDSMGNTVKGQTSTGVFGDAPDAVQLSGGNILLGMHSYNIRYIILDSAFNQLGWSNSLGNPAAISGDNSVSVAADQANHAVLTWMDADPYNPRNLYYALVGADGSVLTPATIFHTSPSSDPYLYATGNTSYSWLAADEVDGTARFSASTFGAPPGEGVAVGIRYANHGGTTGTGVTLIATLDPALIYIKDSSGVTPQVAGSQVTWQLPDLSYLEQGSFIMTVGVPASAYGTTYPVHLEMTSDGPEANPSDNNASAQVMIGHLLYLPCLSIK